MGLGVAELCWLGDLVTYEHCCSLGGFGIGNPGCWGPPLHLTYEDCCTPPPPPKGLYETPLTFSHKPLRRGLPPEGENASLDLLPAERRWASDKPVAEFVQQRWRLVRRRALVAKYRSKAAQQLPMGQHFNAMGTFADLPTWSVRTIAEAVNSRETGKHLLHRFSELARVFDGFGQPQQQAVFRSAVTGEDLMCSAEFAATLLWLCAVHESIGHGGHVDGQVPDGEPGGLPLPQQLSERLPLPWDVVEVGAGWGWMTLLWQQVFQVRSYSVVDLPPAQAVQGIATRTVRNTTAFVSTRLLSDEVLPRYDMFISFNAYTELDPDVRRHYLHKLIIRSRRGVILDNSHALKGAGRRPPEWFGGTTGLDLVRQLRQLGFTVRARTVSEAIGAPLSEPVGVGILISWVNTTEPFPGRHDHVRLVHDWTAAERLANFEHLLRD